KLACVLILITLITSCSWNTVLTPYPYSGARGSALDNVATIWGRYDQALISFTAVDGEYLPSRGGAGVPRSVSLLPGSYDIKVLFSFSGYLYTYVDVPASVEAGHTYVVEYEMSPDNQSVRTWLRDLGADTSCYHQLINKIRG